MNGVTSNGIFSRSATVPTGLLLIRSKPSLPNVELDAPADGSGRDHLRIFWVGVGVAAAAVFISAMVATLSPRCAAIRFGIPSGALAAPRGNRPAFAS